jgi:hypothetical protein
MDTSIPYIPWLKVASALGGIAQCIPPLQFAHRRRNTLRYWALRFSRDNRGEGLRGVDIFKRQAWMIHEDCLGRHTGAEFAQNQFYRNARTSNDRFAIHDVRVHFDAFVGHGLRAISVPRYQTKPGLSAADPHLPSLPQQKRTGERAREAAA